MSSKSKTNSWLWGQDIPYAPNNPKVQEYEQDQKQKKTLKLRMMQSTTPANTAVHQKAVEHSKKFVNWGLAKRVNGSPTPNWGMAAKVHTNNGGLKKMRLF